MNWSFIQRVETTYSYVQAAVWMGEKENIKEIL